MMQNMKNDCQEHYIYQKCYGSYSGNYTVEELAQLPAAALFDVFFEGAGFDVT